jgi:hypothetical protein
VIHGWRASRLVLRATAAGGFDLNSIASADIVHSCGRRAAPAAMPFVSSIVRFMNSWREIGQQAKAYRAAAADPWHGATAVGSTGGMRFRRDATG